MISGQQAENAFRFVLTITPCADQLIEELNRFGAELFEALAKQLLFAALVGAGPMLIVGALVAGLRCRQFFMTSDLGGACVINDQLIFGDAHG